MLFLARSAMPAGCALLFALLRLLMRGLPAAMLMLTVAAGGASAQQSEVIVLKHRAASELLPAIRPLVEPAGSVSAMQDQLVVRTTAANLAQIRKLVAALDHAPHRLLVSVRQDEDPAARGQVYSTRKLDSGRTMQRIQVLEGSRALIETGVSIPVTSTSVAAGPAGVVAAGDVRFRDLSTGFFVSPRLAGDRVTLDISARRDVPANIGGEAGGADLQAIVTTVSGRLGEWIEVGGTGHAADGESSGGSKSWRTTPGARRVLLKVEEIH